MTTLKPQNKYGYNLESLELVKKMCLYIATILGDLTEKQIVIVGGLVPALLIDQDNLSEGTNSHTGTMDLDLGLKIGILEDGQYEEISKRLRGVGFEPDQKKSGAPVHQRWKNNKSGINILIDFLIPPSSDADIPGTLRHLEKDFAAIITPGLELAFKDCVSKKLEGHTIFNEQTSRQISVCGPAAFVILKALAFRNRGENKDAYDLYYMIRNYGSGVEDVASRVRLLLSYRETRQALNILREDFFSHESLGPMRVARFLDDPSITEDVVGFARELISLCE